MHVAHAAHLKGVAAAALSVLPGSTRASGLCHGTLAFAVGHHYRYLIHLVVGCKWKGTCELRC